MTTSTCCYKPPHPLSLSLIAFRRRLLTAGGLSGAVANPTLNRPSTIPIIVRTTTGRGADCFEIWLPMEARHGPPHVGTMIWASRAALGAGGRNGTKG